MQDTLTHTQRSTGQIYLVNGAVLALLYFVVGSESIDYGAKTWMVPIGLVTLAVINLIHAQIMSVQHGWYMSYSRLFAAAVNATEPVPPKLVLTPLWKVALLSIVGMGTSGSNAWFRSTHRSFRAIHYVVATVLLVLAVLVGVMGDSMFDERRERDRAQAALAVDQRNSIVSELADDIRTRTREAVLDELRRLPQPAPIDYAAIHSRLRDQLTEELRRDLARVLADDLTASIRDSVVDQLKQTPPSTPPK